MGEIKLYIGLATITLFAIAVVGFVSQFGDDNQAVVRIGNDSSFESLDLTLNEGIENLEDINEGTDSGFQQSTADTGDEVVKEGGTFKTSVFALIPAASSILNLIKTKIFGGNNALGIFLKALIAIFLFMAFRYAYKSWFGKNPD